MVQPRLAHSADHLDSPAVKADPAADINDLYSWVDGANVVLALTVSPAAQAGAKFSDKVQYVIHTSSGAGFGNTTSNVDIICTFDAAQVAKCWAGEDDFVTGNADTATGITSASGKLKVFAGLRKDPFFFNLEGFTSTVGVVQGAATTLMYDDAGCPTIDGVTSPALVNKLKTSADGGAPVDFFQNLNTLAIVVAVDKSLVTKGGAIMSAWASTNKGQ